MDEKGEDLSCVGGSGYRQGVPPEHTGGYILRKVRGGDQRGKLR